MQDLITRIYNYALQQNIAVQKSLLQQSMFFLFALIQDVDEPETEEQLKCAFERIAKGSKAEHGPLNVLYAKYITYAVEFPFSQSGINEMMLLKLPGWDYRLYLGLIAEYCLKEGENTSLYHDILIQLR